MSDPTVPTALVGASVVPPVRLSNTYPVFVVTLTVTWLPYTMLAVPLVVYVSPLIVIFATWSALIVYFNP